LRQAEIHQALCWGFIHIRQTENI